MTISGENKEAKNSYNKKEVETTGNFGVEQKKITQNISKQLNLDHSGLSKELLKVNEQKNKELDASNIENDLENMLFEKGSTIDYLKDSPLIEDLGGIDNPEVLSLFTHLDQMFSRLMDSYLSNNESIDKRNLMTTEQFHMLRSSFVISLLKGIQEESASDQSGGVLGKLTSWIGGAFGAKNAEKPEDINLIGIAANFLGRLNKFPAKQVTNRLQELVEGLGDAYESGKKPELTLDSGLLLQWFDGSLPGSELESKILLDKEPESLTDEMLRKLGAAISLDEDSLEVLKEFEDIDKVNKLLTHTDLQNKTYSMYASFEGFLKPFKWMLGKDSAKDIIESRGLGGVANMFLGWIGYEGGMDALHKNYLLKNVEDQLNQNQKDAVGYAWNWVTHNMNNKDAYSVDAVFSNQLTQAGVGQQHPLFRHVPLSGNFLKDVLKETLVKNQALPSIPILEKYCKQCFVIEKGADGSELATIDASKFFADDVLNNFISGATTKSFIEFVKNFPPGKASTVTDSQTLVSLWIAESFFAPGTGRAFGDGALAIGAGQFFDVEKNPYTEPQQQVQSGQSTTNLQSPVIPPVTTPQSVPYQPEVQSQVSPYEYPGNYDKAAIEALRLKVPAPLESYANDLNFIKFLFALEDQHKLPRGMLVGIAFVESNISQVDPENGKLITSKAKAKGMFQFLDTTAGGTEGRWGSGEYARKLSKRYGFKGLKGVHIQENPIYGALAAALYCEESLTPSGRTVGDVIYRYNAGPGNWGKKAHLPQSQWPKGVRDYIGMVQNFIDSFKTGQVVGRGGGRDNYRPLMSKYLSLGVARTNNSSQSVENYPPLQSTTYEMSKTRNFGKEKDPNYLCHEAPNLGKVVGLNNVYRSGRPTLETLRYLKEQKGVTTFVCLTASLRQKEPDSYKYLAEQAGVKFIYVPMTSSPNEMSKENFAAIAQAAKLGNMATFCNHGADRTGYLWAMLRKYLFGWSSQEATQEMRAYNSKVHPSKAFQYPLSGGWDPIKSYAKFQAAINTNDFYGFGNSLKIS